MAPPEEKYPSLVSDVYPGIDPSKFKGIHNGKVVFVTGGATGLGLEAAKAFAASGASVFIGARRMPQLEAAKAEIEKLGGKVGIASVDVTNYESLKAGVAAAVELFGHIDIVLANAGRYPDTQKKMGDYDPEDWVSCMNANVQGAFLTFHATLPELIKAKNGYFIVLSSSLAQTRVPGESAYNIAKHAVNRLAEWIDIEYKKDGIKAFAIHPGAVLTDVSRELQETTFKGIPIFTQSPKLFAWTAVRLTSGSEDWLSGRFFDSTWNLDEVAKSKSKIIDQDALKNRLAMPI
ncbi:hypothetical protein M407DRAFT_240435 [Tulasnella calospora MUT 4182]|uniref:Ketoreductase domain-containing protein n=1 Tax=Tulasnella calospora MUT 4182 TaxID=1051891 RepID=A0A0C3LKC0_9AGAM|nr:hypothetical protein M407DRAFT_247060 [Tulasnella calospora MUT 4182]KIO34548.1 hypothetical protein M407DRAFT_240435 [Tulasnella calospora MUT 4182]